MSERQKFTVGDIVTRDGTDRHRVLAVSEFNEIDVECITPSAFGWCAAGERDYGCLPRRWAVIEG